MPLNNIQIWKLATSNSWIYVVALIFLYIIYILRNYIRLIKITFYLDGPPALPLIGNIHYYFKPNVLNEMIKYSTYNIIRFWVSFIPYLAIIQPEDIQIILSSSKHTRKPFVYSLFKNVIGKGLTINDGEVSKMHRNIIQKAFNVHGLEKFTEIFLEHAEYLTSILRDTVNQDMNITKLINDVIYNIQAETVLGLKLIKENKKNNETHELPFKVNEMFASYRFKRPWLLFESLYKLTKKSQIDKQQLDNNIAYCYDIIKKIEKSKSLNSYDMTNDGTQTENGRISLLEFMVNMKQKYSYFNDEAILNECSTFMLAGLESVSTATACMLFLLANHPECQKKCVNELDEIYNNNATLTSFKSLKEMKYLEMCIKETLRLYPAIPVIARCLTEDIKIGGRTIPTGTSVLISPYVTHRIPRYYLDPESFKPERFDPQNSDEKLHPYAYIPFSAGPKNCIGYKFAILEMKVLVSSILRNFVLEPIANKNKIYVKYRMTLRAQGGLWIKFRLRKTM